MELKINSHEFNENNRKWAEFEREIGRGTLGGIPLELHNYVCQLNEAYYLYSDGIDDDWPVSRKIEKLTKLYNGEFY
jgi:hypothetical protein